MNARAILRSENGGYIRSIFPEEQEYWEFLAEKGEVLKSVKQKHGRRITIYRMRTPKEPPVEPSSSSSSDCSLSENDSRAIAGLFEEPTRRQIERWLGWGLLTS